jgi:sulfhydrogenase subunit alpha
MTETTRTIQVGYLARVEGETSLTVRLEEGVPVDVRLSIFEPPRFFEALLRGRSYAEAPDVTARICGICPVAYIMSSSLAMEQALGVTVPAALRDLRKLLYYGEWIESHALHAFLLHLPDFLGFPDAPSVAKASPEGKARVSAGLAIKKAGNALMIVLGGREIHPINARVGGFYRAPTSAALRALLPELEAARERTIDAALWMATLTFPEVRRDWELVALVHPTEYAIVDGRIASLTTTTGERAIDCDVSEFGAHFREEHARWSNALQAKVVGRGSYLTGPLARFALSFDKLCPEARALAERLELRPPVLSPYRSLLVRMVEIVEALSGAIRIIEGYEPPRDSSIDAGARLPLSAPSVGHGATEAPRGMLYHRYALAPDGTILDALIVPPTSQNQAAIEDDLRAIAGELSSLPHDAATRLAELTVRNHDPCISCATHFLRLRVEEVGAHGVGDRGAPEPAGPARGEP